MTRKLNVARWLVLVALSIFLCFPCVAVQGNDAEATDAQLKPQQSTERVAAAACNSLTGPFCAFTDSMGLFTPYMMPISPLDLQQDGSEMSRRSAKTQENVAKWQRKKCFFQHFSSSWMDSGGDAYDIMNQQVPNVDECEKLCCEHAQCQSFTFWRGRTCFLRAQSNTPRQDGDSFSGIRLT